MENELLKREGRNHTGRGTSSLAKNCSATIEERKAVLANILYWNNAQMINTPAECANRLDMFFQRCSQTGEIPTVEKMGLALGCHRTTFWEMENGSKGREIAEMIKRAKAILAAVDAEYVITGKLNPITYIFRSKNYYGMRDQVDYRYEKHDPLGESASIDALADKYIDALPLV